MFLLRTSVPCFLKFCLYRLEFTIFTEAKSQEGPVELIRVLEILENKSF